ncbi:hypothetical protein AQUCO_01400499v1 [Aquilegia coerulea]|uniref:Uncharacterized protein n=1 Tax=Aquilegia coerulea TaxID=218851 RepID=A0A2G5DWV7_AQUCA|nr:hypothetical protein AQUCO_01400499v1 [Aquilegia coerulea]
MFNLDGDIVVEFDDQVPWLLFVNLLAMFLLIVLVYSSTIFAVDNTNTTSGVVEVDEKSQLKKFESRSNCSSIIDCEIFSQHTKVNQGPSVTKDNAATTSTTLKRSDRQVVEIQSADKFVIRDTTRDVTNKIMSSCSYSPCHWLELVSKAFLSCLGLHCSTSQDSTKRKLKNDPSVRIQYLGLSDVSYDMENDSRFIVIA